MVQHSGLSSQSTVKPDGQTPRSDRQAIWSRSDGQTPLSALWAIWSTAAVRQLLCCSSAAGPVLACLELQWSITLDHMLSHQHIGLIDFHWRWMLDWAQGIDCPAWAGLLILGLGWILEACIVLQFLCWKAAQGAFVSCAWAKRLLYEAKSLLYYWQSFSIKPLF